MAGMWCVHHNQRFLVIILLFISNIKHSFAVEEMVQTCGGTINLNEYTATQIHSGILKVDMPTDFSMYQGKSPVQRFCDITIMFEGGINLQIELYYLDIMPISSDVEKCSTGLLVFESNGREVYGGRLCREGWRWEKEHREKKQEKKVVKSSPLTFRLISEGSYKGSGFKVHFNKFRPFWPCNNHREFKCERLQRCVHDDITCDGWDDCGDDSDETEDAGCELLTVAEIFAVIIGVFLVVGTVAATAVFLIKYRKIVKRNRLERKESKLALEEERRSMREPSVVFPHRFNSMESVNRSHYSRNNKMDLDSLMDRMELDKADKFSCKDNMSEKSYKSNRHRSENGSERHGPVNRRNRMSSQGSLGKEKAGIVGSSNPELDKDDKYSNGERRERGRSGREEDKDLEGRRSQDRKRYSDDDIDDEYDSDRERRRRRRSRERRRYDRSDDEDDDSDYERRRRRRRDRDKYDSEEDYDSDRERRRRRRRRYEDSDEDYDSDSERRRRRRSRDRRRYDSDEDYDSDSERKRRSRKNLDEEEKGDSDKESSSRRRRSKDRRRYDSDDDYDSDRDRRRRRRGRDSDEYDSDRDRRRRRSRDRSRDLSQENLEKDPSKPTNGIDEEKIKKSQEPSVSQPVPEKTYPDHRQQPEKDQPGSGDSNRRSPYPYQQPEPEREKPAQRQPKQQVNNLSSPPPNPPPNNEDRNRYSRRPPRSNGGVAPSGPPAESGPSNAWVPRSERKKNRRSRGDLPQNELDNSGGDVYEDVVPKIHLENLGFREESV